MVDLSRVYLSKLKETVSEAVTEYEEQMLMSNPLWAWLKQYDRDLLGQMDYLAPASTYVPKAHLHPKGEPLAIQTPPTEQIFPELIANISSCADKPRMNIVMIGPPGSGKGTHGPSIRDELCICHLATGDMLREAIALGSLLGQTADAIMKRGELVPDQLVIDLIKERIQAAECARGVLFDGFPRTVEQAKMLDSLL